MRGRKEKLQCCEVLPAPARAVEPELAQRRARGGRCAESLVVESEAQMRVRCVCVCVCWGGVGEL